MEKRRAILEEIRDVKTLISVRASCVKEKRLRGMSLRMTEVKAAQYKLF